MKRTFVVLCTASALLWASSAMAISFTEDFESYGPSGSEPLPTWQITSGYQFLPVTTTDNHTPGGSLALLTQNDYGTIQRGETYMFGEEWEGTDAAPLDLSYWFIVNAAKGRKAADVYVELAKGDYTAPTPGTVLAEPIPVVAYTKAFAGESTALQYFDGQQWIGAGYVVGYNVWENITLSVKSNTVDLGSAGGSYADVAVAYTGGFDRINIRTTLDYNALGNGYWNMVDDISLTGGALVPEPASLALLGLGGLFLRRRRA